MSKATGKRRTGTVMLSFRTSAAMADALDALAERLSTPLVRRSRSDAARAALEAGIEKLRTRS